MSNIPNGFPLRSVPSEEVPQQQTLGAAVQELDAVLSDLLDQTAGVQDFLVGPRLKAGEAGGQKAMSAVGVSSTLQAALGKAHELSDLVAQIRNTLGVGPDGNPSDNPR